MISNQKKIQHLLWRAGFGPSVDQIRNLQTPGQAIDRLFSDARKNRDINVVEGQMLTPMQKRGMQKEEMKKMRMESRQQVREVNTAWIQGLVPDESALREKMATFWHGHLACKSDAGYEAQQYVNIIRKNALGKFSDLLFGVVKTPAMMKFLDTMKNRKDSPNENFSRELMELFTLGKGHYTEDDIKNAARAFTGWSIMPPSEFSVRMNQHDSGVKSIFGRRGNFDGDDVINMILENKQTASHITTKIYRSFVNDQVNEERVNDLTAQFYRSGYDIEQLMHTIFTADWFYDEENIGVKIKSPIELMVGMMRTLNITFEDPSLLQQPQRIMGEELLYPPNVAGWPGGKNWIDSSTLMYRLNLVNIMLSQSNYEVVAKGDVEDTMMIDGRGRGRPLKGAADWSSYFGLYTGVSEEKFYETASGYLLQTMNAADDKAAVESVANEVTKEGYIRSITLRILSTPEYQMC